MYWLQNRMWCLQGVFQKRVGAADAVTCPGAQIASYADGDIDFDGDVDLTDLAGLLAVYGTSCP